MSVRFSILMPVYNRAKYVRQAIDSVLAQTFTDYELIAVDDGSTDGSVEILEEAAAAHPDRIKVIRQPNQGPEVARNTAAAAAQGEYLAFLDSDDFFFPSTLATYDRIIRHFDSPPIIVGSWAYYPDGQPLPPAPPESTPVEVVVYEDYLAKMEPVLCVQTMLAIRKSVYDAVGGHRHSTSQTWYGDTFDLLLKLGTYSPCIFIREPRTFAYRVHAGNSLKQIASHAAGIMSLGHFERRGEYPGGKKRLWDRYAVIGGVASTWAWVYCWGNGHRLLALRLCFNTAPMVFAAVCKKLLRFFRKPAKPVFLPDTKVDFSSDLGQLESSVSNWDACVEP